MKKQFFTCNKCGKEELISSNDYAGLARWHHFDAGVAGYGSVLDSCNIQFDLCDECLNEMVNSFLHKDEILHNEGDYSEEYNAEYCYSEVSD